MQNQIVQLTEQLQKSPLPNTRFTKKDMITAQHSLRLLRQIKELQFQKENTKFVPPEFPIRLYPDNMSVNQHNESQLRQQKARLYTIVA